MLHVTETCYCTSCATLEWRLNRCSRLPLPYISTALLFDIIILFTHLLFFVKFMHTINWRNAIAQWVQLTITLYDFWKPSISLLDLCNCHSEVREPYQLRFEIFFLLTFDKIHAFDDTETWSQHSLLKCWKLQRNCGFELVHCAVLYQTTCLWSLSESLPSSLLSAIVSRERANSRDGNSSLL